MLMLGIDFIVLVEVLSHCVLAFHLQHTYTAAVCLD